MRGRILAALAALLVGVVGVFGLVSHPAAGTPTEHADYVVVVGAAGLRWDDVNPQDTPNLWKLAQQGSVGALSVRSAASPTCPSDGWLTLGAGNLATRFQEPVAGQCPAMKVPLTRPDNIGAALADQGTVVQKNNDERPYGAQPGALAEAVRCTAAVGVGAAIAAARPFGRVDKYSETLPSDFRGYLSSCVLSMVDLGTLSATLPDLRRQQAQDVDARLATVLANRPERSLVLVAGLADTQAGTRLHVAIAEGPGYHGGWLTSASTSRPGYVQLADLAPTVLNALGKPMPTQLFAGAAAADINGRPHNLASAVDDLADADTQAGAQHHVTGGFFAVLTVAQLLLFAAVVPLLRRARRHVGLHHNLRPAPAGLVRAVELGLVAVALALPAALLSDAVPWWRTDWSGVLFAGVTVVLVVALTAAVAAGPWWRGALGPAGAVGGIVTAIVGLDVLTGARLQLNGVAGYSALEGGRYAGLGSVGLGLFAAGVLLLTGALAQQVVRRWRPAVVAILGAVAIILVGSPYLGADVGGAVALTAGVCLCAAICTGGWLSFARVAWATVAGLAVTAGFALIDLRRAPADRGRLGQLLTNAVGNGSSHHDAANALGLTVSPITLIAFGAVVLGVIGMLAPWGGLKRVFGLYPSVRAALVGITVAALIGGLVDGVGFVVAGAAAATAVPVAALATLRVLDHADDRTVAVAVSLASAEPPAAGTPGETSAATPAAPPADDTAEALPVDDAAEPAPADDTAEATRAEDTAGAAPAQSGAATPADEAGTRAVTGIPAAVEPVEPDDQADTDLAAPDRSSPLPGVR
jgi:hypothetical protein